MGYIAYLAFPLRAVADKPTLVPHTVCQCGAHEGSAASLGFVLLRRFCCHFPDHYGHAQAEGM